MAGHPDFCPCENITLMHTFIKVTAHTLFSNSTANKGKRGSRETRTTEDVEG